MDKVAWMKRPVLTSQLFAYNDAGLLLPGHVVSTLFDVHMS